MIEDETEEGDVIATSISPFVSPLRYRLELTPPSDVNATAKLKGRVVIEFRIDDTPSLSKLSFNAWNITATRYKLSLVEESNAGTRRRRLAEDNVNDDREVVVNDGIFFVDIAAYFFFEIRGSSNLSGLRLRKYLYDIKINGTFLINLNCYVKFIPFYISTDNVNREDRCPIQSNMRDKIVINLRNLAQSGDHVVDRVIFTINFKTKMRE